MPACHPYIYGLNFDQVIEILSYAKFYFNRRRYSFGSEESK
jgi:hypothetical protein